MRALGRLACALALVLLVPPGAAHPSERKLVPPPAYYAPVIVRGHTFPVARSNWFSVIGLDNDWHDPRFRLINGRWRLVGVHEGNDILAEKGTPILSVSAGRVENVGWTFYSGNRVGVRGDDGRYWFYAHLSAYADGIAPGVRVEPGTVLGRVGNTGYGAPGHEDEFPPHLHVGIADNGVWVNPYPLVRSLYRRSVTATSRAEARLAVLAREGRAAAFDRLVDSLYGV